MKLYEIDNAISSLFDRAEIDEFGELIFPNKYDESVLKALEKDREKKIEGMISWYKDLVGDVQKFEDEITNLEKRKQSLENRAESLKGFLDYIHQGVGNKYGVHKISYRKSTRLLEGNLIELPEQLIQYKTTAEPIKDEIKKAIKNGQVFKTWILEEKQNIQIK